jgi:hypothetical protein
VGKIYQRILEKWLKHGKMMGKWWRNDGNHGNKMEHIYIRWMDNLWKNDGKIWIHVAEGWDKLAKMRILCFFELGDDLFSELVKITREYLGIMDDDSRFWT